MTTVDPFAVTGYESTQNLVLNIPLAFAGVDVLLGVMIGFMMPVAVISGVLVFTIPKALTINQISTNLTKFMLLFMAIAVSGVRWFNTNFLTNTTV